MRCATVSAAALALLLALVPACGTVAVGGSGSGPEVSRVWDIAAARVAAGAPADGAKARDLHDPPDLPERLTQEEAFGHALRNHPRMRRARLLVSAGDADAAQAALRPNPHIGLGYRDEFDMKEMLEFSLGLEVELGGKRRARVEAARARAATARADLIEDLADLQAEIATAFATLAFATELAALVERTAAVAEESLRLIASLHEWGRASEAELLVARGSAAVARAEAAKARAALAAAEREALLSAGIRPGDGAPTPVPPAPETSDAAETARAFDELAALARTQSPVLLSARLQRALAEAEKVVALEGRRPDLSWTAGGGSVDLDSGGSHGEIFGRATLELPIFDRNQGAIAAAAARAGAAEADEHSRALEVAGAVSRLLADVEGLRAETEALERTAVPSAEKALEFASGELEAGRISRLEHLKLESKLLALKLRLARAKHALRTAAIAIKRVAGAPPEERVP
ncbi:MAG: TolC family protein [Planctomycetota bacterium]|jgi:cobalt-zinc-cadmium efflux system outer membrane protein